MSSSVVWAEVIVEDFSSGTYMEQGSQLLHSEYISYSHDLYPEHPDGFHRYQNSIYNYYGEHGEYFVFDAPVELISMDFAQWTSSITVDNLVISLFDQAGGLLYADSISLASSFQTTDFNISNVSKVGLDFAFTNQYHYNDGRDHGWYRVDNITFDTSNQAISEPSIAAVMGIGLLGLMIGRRKSRVSLHTLRRW